MNYLENYPKFQQHFPIHKLKILQNYKPLTFDFVMEHIFYDRKKLDDLMPGNKAFISGLRNPFSQFKSNVHFKHLDDQKHLKGGFQNVFEKYLAKGKINLRGQHYITIPEEYLNSSEKLSKYFNNLEQEFSFILITEYYDASLVLLKRLFCWDTEDIIYSRLKKGKYTYPNTALLKKVEKLHKKLNPEEYALFNHFNRTFWSLVSKQSDDFWEEVHFYQALVKNVSQFCEKFYEKVQQRHIEIFTIISEGKTTPFQVPKSRWNKPFFIDVEDCILMKVEKRFFRNVNILKNYPHLCQEIKKTPQKVPADEMTLRWSKGSRKLIFDPLYCFPSNISKYNLPLNVLSKKSVYDWDDNFSRRNRNHYNEN